ncbi:hypothetical protein PLESTM_001785300 [Pleodorina starrii]|nr:hypothetical protein PLESTM_001785300 [Pleodorina starrii]
MSLGSSGRQPLKAGLGLKPGGLPMGRLPSGSAGPGAASRPQKGQPKAHKPPVRPPAPDPAAAAAGSNYTLGRAAGKRIAQAIEQGALTGTGPIGMSGKLGTDSQGTGVAAGAGGAALGPSGTTGGGGGSRWVWPPLSAAELAAQAAREGGMVDVDDAMDVGELLRQADERMHEFISGDLKAAIRKDEKQLRRAQRQQQPGEGQSVPHKDAPQQQQRQAADVEMQDADGRSAKRQRVAPLETLQPVLGDARSRLRSKLLVAPAKLSRHEERLPGWQPPVELVLASTREHTREVVNSLLRASERAVSVAMRGVRKQAAERRARSRGAAAGEDAGEQCGEVDPDVAIGKADEAGPSARKGAGAGRSGQQRADDTDVDQDGVYAAAIDQVFALLQEAWAGDVMAVLRERGCVRGRPRLQLCALAYSASRVIHAVEMLGYRRRSPRALVDLLREQLDWAVPLLCHVEGAPSMATFVSERLKPAWADTWVATLLDLLAVSYAGEDREGNNEMEFVARWDSDEDWEAGMEEAGGVEAATDALEELQRVAAATAAQQQQGSQQGASEPRASGRATSVSHGRQGTVRNASASGGGPGAAGRTLRQASGSGRPGGGASGAAGGTGPAAGGATAANPGKAGALQAQVMEVDSLRGVVVAGSQRPVGAGRMAKHVARMDPVRPAHMMPAIIARPIIHVAPDPAPERLAAMREEHRLKQRCGNATANLAGLFDKEAPTPGAAAAADDAPTLLGTGAGQGAGRAAAAAQQLAPPSMRAPQDRRPGGAGAEAGRAGGALGGLGGGLAAQHGRASPGGAPAPSGSSTEVGPTPMDDGGRHRSRLPGLDGGGGAGGGALGLARGLFTENDNGEVPAIKFNPGGEGVFSQVATFQIVNKPRPAAPAAAAAGAPALPQSQSVAAAAPPALFVFGAGVAAAGGANDAAAEPRPEGAPAPAEAQPVGDEAAAAPDGAGRGGVLRLFGGDAAAFDGLDDDAALNAAAIADCGPDADPAAEFDDVDGAEDGEREGPPSGCRLQAEEHSADSLLCPKHCDEGDSDSDPDFGDDPNSPRAGQRQPREPVPDACSPCKAGASTRKAAAASTATAGGPTSRLTAGSGGGISSRIPLCAPGGGIMPPRSRKAPPAAAAAAAAAAATATAGPSAGAAAKRGLRSGPIKPQPPRFPTPAEGGAGQQGPRSKAPPPAPGAAGARQPAQRPQAPNATQLAGAVASGKPAAEEAHDGCAPMSVDASGHDAEAGDTGLAQQRHSLDSDAGAPAGVGCVAIPPPAQPQPQAAEEPTTLPPVAAAAQQPCEPHGDDPNRQEQQQQQPEAVDAMCLDVGTAAAQPLANGALPAMDGPPDSAAATGAPPAAEGSSDLVQGADAMAGEASPVSVAPGQQAQVQPPAESPALPTQDTSCAVAATPIRDGPASEQANGAVTDTLAFPVPNRTVSGLTPHPRSNGARCASVDTASPDAALPTIAEAAEQHAAGDVIPPPAAEAKAARAEAEQPAPEAQQPAVEAERPSADEDQAMEDVSAEAAQQEAPEASAAAEAAEPLTAAAAQPAAEADASAAAPSHTRALTNLGAPSAVPPALHDAPAAAAGPTEDAAEASIGCSGVPGAEGAAVAVASAPGISAPAPAGAARFADVLREGFATLLTATGREEPRPCFPRAQEAMDGGLLPSTATPPPQLPTPQQQQAQDRAEQVCRSTEDDAWAFAAAALAPLDCSLAGFDLLASAAAQPQPAQRPDVTTSAEAAPPGTTAASSDDPQALLLLPRDASSLTFVVDLAPATDRGVRGRAGRRRAQLLEVPVGQLLDAQVSPAPCSALGDAAAAVAAEPESAPVAAASAVDTAAVGSAAPANDTDEAKAEPGLPSPVVVAAAGSAAGPSSVAASAQAQGTALALLSPPGPDDGHGTAAVPAVATTTAAATDELMVDGAGGIGIAAGDDANAPPGPAEAGAEAAAAGVAVAQEMDAGATQEAAGPKQPGASRTPSTSRLTGRKASRSELSLLLQGTPAPAFGISAAEAAKLRRQSNATPTGRLTPQTAGKGAPQTSSKGARQTGGKVAPSASGRGVVAHATTTSRTVRSNTTANTANAARSTRPIASSGRTAAPDQQRQNLRQVQSRKRRAGGEPETQDGGEVSGAAATDAGTAPGSTATKGSADVTGNAGRAPSGTATATHSGCEVRTQPHNKRRRKGDLFPSISELGPEGDETAAADAATVSAAAAAVHSQAAAAALDGGGSGGNTAADTAPDAVEGIGQLRDSMAAVAPPPPADDGPTDVAAEPQAAGGEGQHARCSGGEAGDETAAADEVEGARHAEGAATGAAPDAAGAASAAATARPMGASPAHTQVSPGRQPGRGRDPAAVEQGCGEVGDVDSGGAAAGEGVDGVGMAGSGAADGGGEEDGTGAGAAAQEQDPAAAEEDGDTPSPATQARSRRRSGRFNPQSNNPPAAVEPRETRSHSRAAAAAPSASVAPVSGVSTRGGVKRVAAEAAAGGDATLGTKRSHSSRRAVDDPGAEDEDSGVRRSKRNRR